MSDTVKLIVPTAINLLTGVNEEYRKLNKQGVDLAVDVPSLRRRALLVIRETGVLPIQTSEYPDDDATR